MTSFAVDRGDGQVAWEMFTDGSERPLVFSMAKDARRCARDHNKAFDTKWTVVPCGIVLMPSRRLKRRAA